MRYRLPNVRGWRFMAFANVALVAMLPVQAAAQVVDSARVRSRIDSVVPPVVPAAARESNRARLAPPITPKRAFLYSLMLPGFGQSRLDRGTSGALFSSVELAALVMVRRSRADVNEASRYRRDSLPAQFTVVNGIFTGTGGFGSRFTNDLVKTRRLHVEDWIALIAFNHLFSGADAFVAAQLWDVPLSLSAAPSRGGGAVVATLRW